MAPSDNIKVCHLLLKQKIKSVCLNIHCSLFMWIKFYYFLVIFGSSSYRSFFSAVPREDIQLLVSLCLKNNISTVGINSNEVQGMSHWPPYFM